MFPVNTHDYDKDKYVYWLAWEEGKNWQSMLQFPVYDGGQTLVSRSPGHHQTTQPPVIPY